MTKKWIEVNDLSGRVYSTNKNIRFKTPMLISHLCDCSNAYNVVKGGISVTGSNNANRRSKKLTFKNNAPFRLCITKINNTFIGKAEDFDIVMLVKYLLEYGDNYSIKSGMLRKYYRDEVNDDANENNDSVIYRINNNETTIIKSF